MTQDYFPFGRMMTAGFDAWRLSVQVAETMVASQTVIGARMAMLGKGVDGSGKMPFAEFSRLVPEKAAAFGKANIGAAQVMAAMKGAPDSLTGAFAHDSMVMFEWWERSLGAATAWWLPVHARATSNAKRLAPRKSG